MDRDQPGSTFGGGDKPWGDIVTALQADLQELRHDVPTQFHQVIDRCLGYTRSLKSQVATTAEASVARGP